jgi:hypothetical protein
MLPRLVHPVPMATILSGWTDRFVLIRMANERPASWRMPSLTQMEALGREGAGEAVRNGSPFP